MAKGKNVTNPREHRTRREEHHGVLVSLLASRDATSYLSHDNDITQQTYPAHFQRRILASEGKHEWSHDTTKSNVVAKKQHQDRV